MVTCYLRSFLGCSSSASAVTRVRNCASGTASLTSFHSAAVTGAAALMGKADDAAGAYASFLGDPGVPGSVAPNSRWNWAPVIVGHELVYGQGSGDGGTAMFNQSNTATITAASQQWRKGSDLDQGAVEVEEQGARRTQGVGEGHRGRP